MALNIKTVSAEFSIFEQPITNIEKCCETTIGEVYEIIISDQLKEETESYRIGNADKNKVFPFVLFSGNFDGRKDNDLIKHSNLLAIDIDNLDNVKEVKSKLKEDKHTALMYTTPSANGLRVVFGIDTEKATHKDYFLYAKSYFLKEYDIVIDKACKNVSRASFLCYDPDAYSNYSAKEFKISDNKIIEKKISKKHISLEWDEVEKCIEFIEKEQIDITHNYNDWLKIGFALTSEFGEDGRDFYHRISQFYLEYNADTCDKQFDACLNSNNGDINIATFFHYYKEYGITISSKNEHIDTYSSSILTGSQRIQLAKKQPKMKRLFGEFWSTNQICILFGDTGLGKSILTVQLSDKISKGEELFGLKNENPPLKVLVYDFELTDKQFEKRYTNNTGEFGFNDNLLFKQFDQTEYLAKKQTDKHLTFDQWLFSDIENDLKSTNAKVLVIDNITYLNSQSTQDADIASKIMMRLKSLKNNLDISVLVIAHTPKIPKNEPIEKNHLAGSKQLSNFADSIFCIANSGLGYDWCYLKQIKARDGIEIFNEDNVIAIIKSQKDAMLQFTFEDFTPEQNHFITDNEKRIKNLKEIANDLYKELGSYRKVGDKLGISHQTVKRYISKP